MQNQAQLLVAMDRLPARHGSKGFRKMQRVNSAALQTDALPRAAVPPLRQEQPAPKTCWLPEDEQAAKALLSLRHKTHGQTPRLGSSHYGTEPPWLRVQLSASLAEPTEGLMPTGSFEQPTYCLQAGVAKKITVGLAKLVEPGSSSLLSSPLN